MVMVAAMTAEEIIAAEEAAAAAEAAAAETAAAEQAAAAQAAQTTAAQQTAAATQSAGIMGAGTGTGAGLGSTGAGITAQVTPAIETATAVGGPGAGGAGTQTAMVNAMETAGAAPGGITAVPEAATTLTPAGETAATTGEVTNATRSLASANGTQLASVNPNAATLSGGVSDSVVAPETQIFQSWSANPPPTGAETQLSSFDSFGKSAVAGSPEATIADPTGLAQQQLEVNAANAASTGAEGPGVWDRFEAFADKHPFMTGAALYTGAYNMGLLDQKQAEMPQKKSYGNQYTISKNFKATEATPNVYKPSYRTYAEGGVMSVGGPSSEVAEPRKVINPSATITGMANGEIPGYAKGGNLSDTLDFYKQLTEGQTNKGATAPKADADVGIYYDLDPETRYQDPLTAAQIRQSKLNKRANLQLPTSDVMKRPTPMGQLNLAPPGAKAQQGGSDTTEAAQGGIMQASSSLGGYAAGGNPRLLKGPGDGMSDNIPAMIGHKQPARLADGEFVIPADVVSHLGNGSTEAGAKRLHEMMSRVRKERTGNPKQGKQINPNKYLPK